MARTRNTLLSTLACAAAGFFGASEAQAAASSAWSASDHANAVVAELMADAKTRSSLAGEKPMAGWDKGFYLSDPAGNFKLNISGYTQFRYIANFRQDADTAAPGSGNDTADEIETGFNVTRAYFTAKGHVYSPKFFYFMKGYYSGTTGSFNLLHYNAGYKFDDNWHVKFGQFRIAFLREWNVTDAKQLVMERSVVSDWFNTGESQGIEVGYTGDKFRFQTAFSDGFNSWNTSFDDNKTSDGVSPYIFNNGESDYAFTGRFEFKPHGQWGRFGDMVGTQGGEFAAMFGAGIHYEASNNTNVGGTNQPEEAKYFSWTVDVNFEGDGWTFMAGVVGAHTEMDNINGVGGADVSWDDYGFVTQVGTFIPDTDWEVFARYAGIFGDDSRTGGDDFNTITVGANWYMHGHAAKFTIDGTWYMDDANSLGGAYATKFSGSDNRGYLGDSDDGEFALRMQVQVMF